ncbi:MAG TPA: diadenylate cyclase CdaA [Candidatus Acidoferrales bacterium]|nr:diadenylate cyclase CdaA [Candidatus Acidoferrales bacterium]
MAIALAFPLRAISQLHLRAAIDIIVIAIIIYYILNLLKGTRAVQMAVAIMLLVAFYYGAQWARLGMIEWLLTTLLPYFVIALIILFQPEIRRALSRLGRTPLWRAFGPYFSQGGDDDLVLAANYFSQNRIGALIVLEQAIGLRTYVESGIPLDAVLSYDLLLAIFRPGGPLHDGAVIVCGGRLAAAACFLPLSLNPTISNQLGTRHRAAIGICEESDAVVLIVSEETGSIGLATGGTIEMDLTAERLSERLGQLTKRSRRLPVLPAAAERATARK